MVKVEEEYKFEMPKVDDYGHCIKIDINSLKSFKYASNTFSNTVHSKLRAYQSPLNNVWNKEVVDAANILLKFESTENIIEIENIIKYNFEKNLEEIRNFLSKVSNRDLESVVEKLFLNQGYSLESRNSYDGKGGDADLVLTKCLPILEEVDESKYCDKIYIQIKYKDGLYNDREGIDQLNQIIKIKELENGSKLYLRIEVDYNSYWRLRVIDKDGNLNKEYLTKSLKEFGFKVTDWWLGWKYCYLDESSLEIIDFNKLDSKLAIILRDEDKLKKLIEPIVLSIKNDLNKSKANRVI